MFDAHDDVLGLLGWDAYAHAVGITAPPTGALGRVARVDRGRAAVVTSTETVRARPAGLDAATGDWVVVEGAVVTERLPRRSAFVRGDPMEGAARGPQVVAANVDVVLVVQSLTNGPNIRRLERELVLAFESGADPVVVLTKSDLVAPDDARLAVQRATAAAAGIDVVVTSARSGEGVDAVRSYGRGHRTLALIGASGVGKSTLVNHLVGTDVQPTQSVRVQDDRGRHTTTARELVLVPGGGILVDTPGLRAVSLWDADDGFSRVFADIDALAERCRFANCSHGSEPECAVQDAIARGSLERERFEHFLRLDEELEAQARDARQASPSSTAATRSAMRASASSWRRSRRRNG